MGASLTALSAILMALYAREKTGRGDYIDIAMFDALLAPGPRMSPRRCSREDRAPVAKDMRPRPAGRR